MPVIIMMEKMVIMHTDIRVVMMMVVMTNDNDGDHDKYLG
jgi:hypothetical protein